jgi:sterol-4alpha-carboxylate 3-dehydrogenase (decarboxylating)
LSSSSSTFLLFLAMATEKRGDLGRVVVIGGNGFLGHHIIKQVLFSWDTSHVASIDLRCQRNRHPDAEYHECDITDTSSLISVLDEIHPDVVIHTASPQADHAIGDKVEQQKKLFKKVNVDGTQSVVDACRKTGVKALVYTSSASIISDMQSDLFNADERWPVIRGDEQIEYYSETKAAAEEIVLNANRADDSKFVTCAIRPAGLFGEGDVQALAGFLYAYRDGKDNFQMGDNNNLFDFTYVGNAAFAHLLAAKLLLATAVAPTAPLDHEKVDGEAFFITNDAPVYFWDFARAVWATAGSKRASHIGYWTIPREVASMIGVCSEIFASILGKKPTITKLRANLSSMTRYYNITKAKRVLHYRPIWTLQEGITKGIKWFTEEEKKLGKELRYA